MWMVKHLPVLIPFKHKEIADSLHSLASNPLFAAPFNYGERADFLRYDQNFRFKNLAFFR